MTNNNQESTLNVTQTGTQATISAIIQDTHDYKTQAQKAVEYFAHAIAIWGTPEDTTKWWSLEDRQKSLEEAKKELQKWQ